MQRTKRRDDPGGDWRAALDKRQHSTRDVSFKKPEGRDLERWRTEDGFGGPVREPGTSSHSEDSRRWSGAERRQT